MNEELTPWFKPATKPVHIGYYESEWLPGVSEPKVRHWGGKYWEYEKGGKTCSLQQFYWRGLAKKP